MNVQSRVYLVGAGPGDPDLLTVKALRLLREADVVVYDRLVSEAVLALIPDGTKRVFVGKASGAHTLPQDQINELLGRLARKRRIIVRLKGGDPYVFGRGSEEALYLARQGIPFEVVPGITSATGCAAAAGIPLTHRGLATGFRVVTGHCRDGAALDGIPWSSLADPTTTLVVYMGLANAARICRELQRAGLAASVPAAAVERGTTPQQRVHVSTLGQLPADLVELGFQPPTLLIVGHVAGLAATLGPAGLGAAAVSPEGDTEPDGLHASGITEGERVVTGEPAHVTRGEQEAVTRGEKGLVARSEGGHMAKDKRGRVARGKEGRVANA